MELVKEEQGAAKAEKVVEFTPARGHILVRPHPRAERSEGGIYLPPPTLGQQGPSDLMKFTGTVLRIGPSRYLSTGEEGSAVAEVGQDVCFTQTMPWMPMSVQLVGEEAKEEVYLLDQDDIMGVFG